MQSILSLTDEVLHCFQTQLFQFEWKKECWISAYVTNRLIPIQNRYNQLWLTSYSEKVAEFNGSMWRICCIEFCVCLIARLHVTRVSHVILSPYLGMIRQQSLEVTNANQAAVLHSTAKHDYSGALPQVRPMKSYGGISVVGSQIWSAQHILNLMSSSEWLALTLKEGFWAFLKENRANSPAHAHGNPGVWLGKN